MYNIEKHRPVGDNDYFKSLSPQGLALCQRTLQEDVQKEQEEYPVSATMKTLIFIGQLRTQRNEVRR